MSLQLNRERPIDLSPVVGGNAKESLGSRPIVVDSEILFGAQEKLGPFLARQNSGWTEQMQTYRTRRKTYWTRMNRIHWEDRKQISERNVRRYTISEVRQKLFIVKNEYNTTNAN